MNLPFCVFFRFVFEFCEKMVVFIVASFEPRRGGEGEGEGEGGGTFCFFVHKLRS